MTNNFEIIRDFLTTQFSRLSNCEYSANVDTFYNVALIDRKKDNALVDGKVKSYTINTIYDLDDYQQEIITICDALKEFMQDDLKRFAYYTNNWVIRLDNKYMNFVS